MDGGYYLNAFTLLRGEDDKVSTTRLVKKVEAIMAEREAKQEQQQYNDVASEYESWDSRSSTIDEEEKESESEFEDKSLEQMIMKKKFSKSDDRKRKVGGKSLLMGYGGNPNSKEEKERGWKKWMRSQLRFLLRVLLWHEVLVSWKSIIAFIVIAISHSRSS